MVRSCNTEHEQNLPNFDGQEIPIKYCTVQSYRGTKFCEKLQNGIFAF